MMLKSPLRQHVSSRAAIALGLSAAVVFTAACSGGSGGEENVVVYYSTRSEQGLDAFEAAFEEAHPDIDLQVIKGGNDDIVARLLTETSRQQADVAELGAAYMDDIAQTGVLAPIGESIVNALPPDTIAEGQNYAPTRYSSHVIPYNTDLVPEDRVPQTHEDFLDPDWTGKFVIATGDVEWAFQEYTTRGEEGAREFFRAIKAQQPMLIDQGRGAIAEMVASGQAAAAATTQLHNLEPRIEQGLPIAGTPFDPPVILIDYIATFTDAPHPEATQVFLDWLYSEQGFETDASLRQARIGDPASLELLADPDTILMDPSNLDEQDVAATIFSEELLAQ